MSPTDAFFLVVRWLHTLSAVAWIGGCIFYLAVLWPLSRHSSSPAGIASSAMAGRFRILVDLCIVILVASGGLLAFDRLTDDAATVSYVVVLAVKVALSAWMFVLVQMERRSSGALGPYRITNRATSRENEGPLSIVRVALSGYGGITVMGITVFLLSDVLRALFEMALRA